MHAVHVPAVKGHRATQVTPVEKALDIGGLDPSSLQTSFTTSPASSPLPVTGVKGLSTLPSGSTRRCDLGQLDHVPHPVEQPTFLQGDGTMDRCPGRGRRYTRPPARTTPWPSSNCRAPSDLPPMVSTRSAHRVTRWAIPDACVPGPCLSLPRPTPPSPPGGWSIPYR